MSVACNTILYRAILRKAWFDPDSRSAVKPEAFFRRRPSEKDGQWYPRDEDGLSLFRAEKISAEECMKEFGTCFGIVSLHSGRLKDLGLNIVLDDQDSRKVLVDNLPFENPGDADQEKLVGDVAVSARIVIRSC